MSTSPESEQGTGTPRYAVIPRVSCFLRHGGEVLLLKGAPDKRLWAGRYNGIGGHVERGEDPLTAARREVREEAGLEVEALRLGGIVHVCLSEGPGVLLFLFTGEAPTREVRPSAEGTLEWVDPERIPTLPVVEDLPALLPRLLAAPAGAAPFFARSRYDAQGRLRVEFTERVFALRLAPELKAGVERYAHWLRHLLERLGRQATLAAWAQAAGHREDALLAEILDGGWRADPAGPVDVAGGLDTAVAVDFACPVEGVTADEARALIEQMPPFPQVRRRLADPNVIREITTYQSLHLSFHGLALLIEALIDRHGKQGELIAYDALSRWVEAHSGEGMAAEDFLKTFNSPFDPATRHGAGLDYTLVRASADEVVLHIHGCAWARYYRERHPRVGYLLACSMDETTYRGVNPRIRMQRTTTLMEGGTRCDFRIYVLPEPGRGEG